MSENTKLNFEDNPAIKDRLDKYENVSVDVEKVLLSWKGSLFSFEWVTPDGRIKDADELSDNERIKRAEIEACVVAGKALPKPVLGIGLLENIEIGIGRHVFLTAAARGMKEIPVHIPKAHKEDFEAFLS
jgi:hypothetical protein